MPAVPRGGKEAGREDPANGRGECGPAGRVLRTADRRSGEYRLFRLPSAGWEEAPQRTSSDEKGVHCSAPLRHLLRREGQAKQAMAASRPG